MLNESFLKVTETVVFATKDDEKVEIDGVNIFYYAIETIVAAMTIKYSLLNVLLY